MKKVIAVLLVMVCLCGCGARETIETIADEMIVPVMAQPKDICLDLPGEVLACMVENGSSRLYLNDGYSVAVQTMESGNLDATIREMTGYAEKDLTVIHTAQTEKDRYEFVWVSAGETGDQVGHGIILDDGTYHYCLSVLQDSETMDNCQIIWSEVYRSFDLV